MRMLLPVLLMLAGCGDRRDFDERYSDTQKEIESRSAALENRHSEANETQDSPARP